MPNNRRFLGLVLIVVIGWGDTCRAALTGQYLFEEGVGAAALDTSGNFRHGSNTSGAMYVAGLYPGSQYALQMNSAGPNLPDLSAAQSVLLPADTNFIRTASGATLAAWIRLDGGSNDRTILAVSNGTTGTGGPRAQLEITNYQGSTRLLASASKVDGPSANGVISTTDVAIGEIYFVAGVFDFLNSSVAVYVNGMQENFGVILGWAGNSADTANRFAEIGSAAVPSNVLTQQYFPGVIDGVRIFDRALSTDEVQQMYQFPDSIPEPASGAVLGVAIWVLGGLGWRRRVATSRC